MMFTIYTVVLCMVLIGGKDIIIGTMETGQLTSVIVYALQIMTSLMMVSFVFVLIMIAQHLPTVLQKCWMKYRK